MATRIPDDAKRNILRLSSRQRLDPTTAAANDCVIQLREPQTVVAAQVVSMTVPASSYLVPSGYNWVDTSFGNVQVPVGTYTGTTLAAALQTALVAADATATCTYSTLTGKFTIARTGAFSMPWSTGTHADTNLRRQLGFAATDLAAAATYTGGLVADLTYPSQCFVRSRALALGAPRYVGSTTARTTEIARVPLSSVFGGINHWSADLADADYVYLTAGNLLDRIDIQLYDEYDRLLELNGRDWELEIEVFTTERRR